jgi:hypothetical protein
VREFWIGVVLIAAVSGLLLLPSITGLTAGVGDSGLFLFLNACHVILILILASSSRATSGSWSASGGAESSARTSISSSSPRSC